MTSDSLKDIENLRRHESGLWIRKGYDSHRVTEVASTYALDLVHKGDRVIDIGACFGAYSFFALRAGAAFALAVEAAPYNWPALRANLASHDDAAIVEAAAVSRAARGDVEEVTFTYTGTAFGSGSTQPIIPIHNAQTMTVPARALEDLYELDVFTVMKMDCEGGEFELLWDTAIPDTLELLILETHFSNADDKAAARALWDMLTKFGFRIVRGAYEVPVRARNATNVWTRNRSGS